MLSVKQGGIKYQFEVFGMTRHGIEPRPLGPVANTLTIRHYIYIYIYKQLYSYYWQLNPIQLEIVIFGA